ncbi:NSP-interacting kinase 1-like protein [Tanacetum coccineum]
MHLLDTSRALRLHSNLPIKFWGDCILIATYLINKMPVNVLDWKSHFEKLYETNDPLPPMRKSTKQYARLAWLKDFVTSKVPNSNIASTYYPLFVSSDFKGIIQHHIAFLENVFATLEPTSYNQASNSISAILSLKTVLDQKFTIKDLGLAKYFLGIKMCKTEVGTYLNQRKYILDSLSDATVTRSKPLTFPLPTQLKLSLDKGNPLPDAGSYRRFRLGCMFDDKEILNWLLHISWAFFGFLEDQKAGFSRSSTEAKYKSMAATTCELLWLGFLLKDLHIQVQHPVTLFCNNKSAQQLAANPCIHDKTKHLDVDCHFTKDKIQEGFLQNAFIPTHLQLADIMTKALGQEKHTFLVKKLGLSEALT